MHKYRSYGPDKLNLWPFYHFTFKSDRPKKRFQVALLLLRENTCAKLLWNPCINVEVMARTSSSCDHAIIWPSSVTLTFNLPKQMFQIALLLLKDNTWAKLFWSPCINVEVMARTSFIYDHFIIWPSSVTLNFNRPPKHVSNGTTTPQGEHLCIIILKFMHKCRTYGSDKLIYVTFKCDLQPLSLR